jgi:hypothetical protein
MLYDCLGVHKPNTGKRKIRVFQKKKTDKAKDKNKKTISKEQ